RGRPFGARSRLSFGSRRALARLVSPRDLAGDGGRRLDVGASDPDVTNLAALVADAAHRLAVAGVAGGPGELAGVAAGDLDLAGADTQAVIGLETLRDAPMMSRHIAAACDRQQALSCVGRELREEAGGVGGGSGKARGGSHRVGGIVAGDHASLSVGHPSCV